jgi:flagellar M-ring protein FliF
MAEFVLSPDRLWSAFRSQRLSLQGLWAGALVLIGVLLFSLGTSLRQPVYAPLYGHLSDRDGGAVLEALDKLNVPYKVVNGAIQVPAPELDATRFRLAAQGLPKGENGGFDAMAATPALGMTSFQEQIGYQHALEAELSRTLENLAPVASARVHLALPKPTAFLREGPQPSAAVLIKTKPGTNLDEEQVQSIRQIVAKGVPRMSVAQVGIVNQQGELLARAEEAERQALSPDQQEAVRMTEAQLANRVTEALTPWLGKANIRVQVAARLNFVETEITRERARSGAKGSTERSVQRSREPSGRIERLSALVVVNETSLPESERQAPATQKKIQQLAIQALGMDSQRRDSLQVILLPFERAPLRIPRAPDPLPVANQTRPEVISQAGAMALGLAALLVLGALWQMRSMRKRVTHVEPVQPAVSPFDVAVETTRESVLADPARAASVIRLWVQS